MCRKEEDGAEAREQACIVNRLLWVGVTEEEVCKQRFEGGEGVRYVDICGKSLQVDESAVPGPEMGVTGGCRELLRGFRDYSEAYSLKSGGSPLAGEGVEGLGDVI